MKPPKWAVNAANGFRLPTREIKMFDRSTLPPHKTIDADRLHAALVALQLRAYRRAVKDEREACAAIAEDCPYDRACQHCVGGAETIRNRGKTAEEKK